MPTKRPNKPQLHRTPAPYSKNKALQAKTIAQRAASTTTSWHTLQESEPLYRLLVENAPGAFVLVDLDGQITLANTQSKAMFGYDSDELVGQALETLIPNHLKELHVAHRRHFLANPSPRHLGRNRDLHGRRKDGSEFPVEIGISSVMINGEAFTQAFIIDISERKLAEQALERQNRRLSELYAVGQVVNSTLDVGKILDFVVDEAIQVTHAERGLALVVDLVARTFVRRSLRGFTPDETARAEEMPLKLDQGLNGQAYRTGHIVRIDDVREEPGYFPLIASTRSELVLPILREHEVLGNIDLQSPNVGAFCEVDTDYLKALAEQAALAIYNARLYHELETYSEILERTVNERTEQLAASKDRIETILGSVGDALLVLRIDGRIEQVNSAFERQTGYSSVEAELKNHHDLLQLEFGSKGDYQGALEMLAPGQVWQGETKVRRKDGSLYEAGLTIAPVRDANGMIRRLVAIMRDITPLKEVERAKDEFVSNVSHELRTPITSLRLNCKLLHRNPSGQERYVERIEREVDRLDDLIESLLRLSRLDQGSVQLEMAPLDLNLLAAQYANDRAALAESRGLNLTFEGVPDLAPVMGDKDLLGQALSVLLTNALNYTPKGGRVTVATHGRETSVGNWAGFSVSDTGSGISSGELPQLFTRFFRGSVGRKSGTPGTGLGLAIAREIIERHSGQI